MPKPSIRRSPEPVRPGTGAGAAVGPTSPSYLASASERDLCGPGARILIADSHPLMVEALADCVRTIKPNADIVQATRLADAIERIAATSFDLILLGSEMPDAVGLEGLRRLRERFPDLPIAVISGTTDGRLVLEATQLGATGCLPMDLPVPTLLKALELIFLGAAFVPVKALQDWGLRERETEYQMAGGPAPKSAPRALTPREIEVLVQVEGGKTNRDIAKIIGRTEATVAFHLKNAFRKLGVRNRSEAGSSVRRLGIGGRRQP